MLLSEVTAVCSKCHIKAKNNSVGEMPGFINITSSVTYRKHTCKGPYSAESLRGILEAPVNDIRTQGVSKIIGGTVQRNNLVKAELRAKKGAGENKIALDAAGCNSDVRPT
jgi:hypothetical protein